MKRPSRVDPQYVADGRATLEAWGFKASDLSDTQAVKLFHQESVRRWRALAVAARQAADSVQQMAASVTKFNQAILLAAKPN